MTDRDVRVRLTAVLDCIEEIVVVIHHAFKRMRYHIDAFVTLAVFRVGRSEKVVLATSTHSSDPESIIIASWNCSGSGVRIVHLKLYNITAIYRQEANQCVCHQLETSVAVVETNSNVFDI